MPDTDRTAAPPRRGSLVEQAYALAKSRVLHAQLLPDSFVDEAALAAELGTSKTPVRQALGRLAGEGFIRVLPQRGTMVNRITVADIEQVYHLRELLEPAAGELAATRATPEQVAQLQELDEAFQRSGERSPDLDTHHRLHVGVARIAGSARLTKMVAELQDQMQWFLAVRAAEGAPLPPAHRHTELIQALRDGDARAAGDITRESLAASRATVLGGELRAGWRPTSPAQASATRPQERA